MWLQGTARKRISQTKSLIEGLKLSVKLNQIQSLKEGRNYQKSISQIKILTERQNAMENCVGSHDNGNNRRNYQKELDALINGLQEVPTLFLHSCCAPCSSYVLEYLSEYFLITDFYYNPNIEPEEEYQKRAAELERLISRMHSRHPIRFLEGAYDPTIFHEMAKGMEDYPEGGERCFRCYELRMREAAKLAAEGGYDYFTTTLSISPLKNAQKINEIGEKLAVEYGVKHLPSDFKKKNGYLRSIELSKKYDLYRQDYCGCVFSRAERLRQKKEVRGTLE